MYLEVNKVLGQFMCARL